ENAVRSTPLIMAAAAGHTQVVKLLLEKGADMEIKNKRKETALSLAQTRKHDEVVSLLKEHESNSGLFSIFK
ncbi:ankyrin repeat domain-containing protein, partial [Kaarinaea lacus]